MPYGTLALDAISTSGNLTVTGNLTVSGNDTANTYNLVSQTLGTATAGRLEYDGRVPYFTPLGTQRGVVPGMQYYRLENNFTGANQTAAQSWFNGTGNLAVTLSSNTVYNFEALYYHYRTGAATSHTVSSLFGGTATLNNIIYTLTNTGAATAAALDTQVTGLVCNTASATVWTTARTSTIYAEPMIRGTVSVNAGGTFIPQYSLSATPGSPGYTTAAGSYFAIWPVGTAGSNTSIGTWA